MLNTTRFHSGEHLSDTIMRYVKLYNQNIPQRALKHSTPIECLQNWYQKHPELFRKRPYNQGGLDTPA